MNGDRKSPLAFTAEEVERGYYQCNMESFEDTKLFAYVNLYIIAVQCISEDITNIICLN